MTDPSGPDDLCHRVQASFAAPIVIAQFEALLAGLDPYAIVFEVDPSLIYRGVICTPMGMISPQGFTPRWFRPPGPPRCLGGPAAPT